MNKKTKLAIVPPQPAPPPAPAPPPDIDVTLSLSAADRWFAAQSLVKIGWGGGEAAVMVLHTIHQTLKLAEIPLDKPPGGLSRSAKSYTLKASHIETLIRILCGADGSGYAGHAGPMLAQVVIRLRTQIKKAREAQKARSA